VIHGIVGRVRRLQCLRIVGRLSTVPGERVELGVICKESGLSTD
jgi:hypothetical protein